MILQVARVLIRSSLTYKVVFLLGLSIFSSCSSDKKSTHADDRIFVVTTTTMITDMVNQIAGDKVQLNGLMGPGVDPHLYEPIPSDGIALSEADLIFYNGLFLEGQMISNLKDQGGIDFGSSVSEDLLRGEKSYPDPHIWGNAEIWANCVPLVVEALIDADPSNSSYYSERGDHFIKVLMDLHQWARSRISTLPEDSRILITSHDAFEYFGEAYGLDVVALQGISTATEAGIAERVKLVDFIKKNKIKSIFVESSVSPEAIKSIAEDSGVRIGGELFSDAMGEPGDMEEFNDEKYDLGTYQGMIKHNINTIVEALK
ncbi:MAG: zinc ABC transporter substrate-binding protein [Verrucomicrobiota bacterium]|nr:zinc ABC transporter substrate-binding protein [Verrucomicrobiota bacterium]MED5471120.1 zinc ABC transporter substrate-binding protein [Verrucomicrobiota bacterium]MEE2967251.1 zinc ABC transporter substrate-binding protein [Verrucomicrobiota bacterium]